MRTVTPSYAGITYEKIEKEGVQWPCPTLEHPGTPILHVNGPGRGRGLLKALDWIPSPDTCNPEYPIVLTSCRILYHYHTRTQTDKTPGISTISVTPSSLTPRCVTEVKPIRIPLVTFGFAVSKGTTCLFTEIPAFSRESCI